MSDALVLYSVPLGRLHALVGSRDERVLAEIEGKDGDFLDKTDEIFQSSDDEDADEPLRCRDALRHILAGGPYQEGWDAIYVYSVQFLCRHLGREADTRALPPGITWAWIEGVDRFLIHIGFPLRVSQLAGGGAPIEVPDNAAPPEIGWWPRDRYAEALAVLRDYRPDGLRPELAGALVTLMGALHQALEGKDDVLVGIYS